MRNSWRRWPPNDRDLSALLNQENAVALIRLARYCFAGRFVMEDTEYNIEELESQFPAIAGSAFAAARERILASGQSVLQSEQGYIYEVFPDGRRVLVKKIEPPTSVQAGRKIAIR